MAETAEERRARLLRPPGFDDLGLRRALSGALVPLLVAAMTLLAALAVGGAVAASTLADRWRQAASVALSVQVPEPAAMVGERSRLDAALALVRAATGVTAATPMDEGRMADLLRPWLGSGAEALALPMPALIEIRPTQAGPDLNALQRRLDQVVPGATVQSETLWVGRLATLARRVQVGALGVVVVVALVATAVVAAATRAALAARRETLVVVHGLGATDGWVAGRFALRLTLQALAGGVLGVALAVPALLAFASLAGPILGTTETLPPLMVGVLTAFPPLIGAIGFVTAQICVRLWLRRLP